MRINPFYLHGEEMTPVRKLLALKALAGGAPLSEYTVTGNPVSFDTNVAKPMSVVAAFSPVQVGTGDPSPDNVRPITGFSGAKIVHLDENLLSINRAGGQSTQGITYTPVRQNDKTVAVKVEGERTNTNPFFNLNYVDGSTKAIAPGTYKISGGTSQVRLQIFYKDSGGTEKQAGYDDGSGATITLADDITASWARLLVTTDAKVDTVVYPIIAASDSVIESVSVTFPALGKNLFDKNNVTDGKVWWNGNTISTSGFSASAKIPVIPGETYNLNRIATGNNTVCFFDIDGTYLQQQTGMTGNVTIPSGAYFAAFNVMTEHLDTAMFEKGSTASAYEPYNATAYGGTLDLSTGVLTVEYKDFTKTWGDYIAKTVLWDNTRGVLSIASYPSKTVGQAADAKCNIAPRGTGWSEDSIHFYTNEGSCIVILPNDTDDSTEIQVVYPLATPLVYQLSPAEILSLVGDNVIWSDLNGDLTVVYKKKG